VTPPSAQACHLVWSSWNFRRSSLRRSEASTRCDAQLSSPRPTASDFVLPQGETPRGLPGAELLASSCAVMTPPPDRCPVQTVPECLDLERQLPDEGEGGQMVAEDVRARAAMRSLSARGVLSFVERRRLARSDRGPLRLARASVHSAANAEGGQREKPEKPMKTVLRNPTGHCPEPAMRAAVKAML